MRVPPLAIVAATAFATFVSGVMTLLSFGCSPLSEDEHFSGGLVHSSGRYMKSFQNHAKTQQIAGSQHAGSAPERRTHSGEVVFSIQGDWGMMEINGLTGINKGATAPYKDFNIEILGPNKYRFWLPLVPNSDKYITASGKPGSSEADALDPGEGAVWHRGKGALLSGTTSGFIAPKVVPNWGQDVNDATGQTEFR